MTVRELHCGCQATAALCFPSLAKTLHSSNFQFIVARSVASKQSHCRLITSTPKKRTWVSLKSCPQWFCVTYPNCHWTRFLRQISANNHQHGVPEPFDQNKKPGQAYPGTTHYWCGLLKLPLYSHSMPVSRCIMYDSGHGSQHSMQIEGFKQAVHVVLFIILVLVYITKSIHANALSPCGA